MNLLKNAVPAGVIRHTMAYLPEWNALRSIGLIFLFNLMGPAVHAQTEKIQGLFSQFKTHYNSGEYEAIFKILSPEMQKTLPLDKCISFFSGLKMQAGKIQEESLIKPVDGSVALFKTQFEKAVFGINLSMDEQNRISGLLIKPFTGKQGRKLVNMLETYPKDLAASIQAHCSEFPNQTQLALVLLRNGRIAYYGVILRNDTLFEIKNQNEVFEIGSLTKVFSSTVLASLVMDKKLKLEDPIHPYYPDPFSDSRPVSFLSLSNHTSGLPRLPGNMVITDQKNPYKNYGAKELNEYLSQKMKLEKDAPVKYAYSNLGAGLLGHSLGLSQKTSFEKLLEKRIFKKYKMKNTFTGPKSVRGELVKGLDEKGNEVSNWEFDVLLGAGGILSTAEDMVKFALAHFDDRNKELALTRIPTFEINERRSIGLGWHIEKSDKGPALQWHNGATGGYTSCMILDPKNKNGIIVLSNVSGLTPARENIDKMCFDLMD
jgi:CubicO group peptidase (beta-lactamase class C family)